MKSIIALDLDSLGLDWTSETHLRDTRLARCLTFLVLSLSLLPYLMNRERVPPFSFLPCQTRTSSAPKEKIVLNKFFFLRGEGGNI